MTLCMLSAGDYSDYRVVAIFSTREQAQAVIDAHPSDEWNGIEERELDPDVPPSLPDGYQWWHVWMKRDGSSRSMPSCYGAVSNISEAMGHRHIFNGEMYATVAARDEQHAVKIVNERRVQLIASGEWA